MSRNALCFLLLVLLAISGGWLAADAQESPRESKASPAAAGKPAKPTASKPQPPAESKPRAAAKRKPAKGAAPAAVDPEQETAALEFAGRHHPELVELLASLKQSNSQEYARAIRELFRTSERLALVREKDPQKYDLELQAWKLQSQIRLLAARLTMAPDPALEQELRDAVVAKSEIRLQLLQHERDEVASRLQKLDASLETLRKSPTEHAEKEFQKVLGSIDQSRTARNRPAAQRPPNKTPKKSKPAPAEASAVGTKPGQD
jgi:hypothetical protein